MPRTIEINDDIYDFLQANAPTFREMETVLGRLLKLIEPEALPSTAPSVYAAHQSSPLVSAPESPLMRFLAEPSFQRRNATDKFLRILGFAYKQDPAKFEKVLEVSGHRRKWFARSKEEIEKSGKSTHPHPIPDSKYWAMTNADNDHKREMLKRALEVLDYSPDNIRAAERAIF